MKRNWKLCAAVLLAFCLAFSGCSSSGGGSNGSASDSPGQSGNASQPAAGSEAPAGSDTEGGTEAAGSGVSAPAEFDQNLMGTWLVVSETHNGSGEFSIGTYLSFLADGRFFGDFSQYSLIRKNGMECPVTTADGTSITIYDDLVRFAAQVGTSDETEPPYEDIAITYEFSDISESQRSDAGQSDGAFYQKYPNDLLTFHVTGTYDNGPTSKLSIDSTLVYQRAFPFYDGATLYGILEPSLEGEWSDNYGNEWSFFYDSDGEFSFTLTDQEGTEYVGSSVLLYSDESDPECVERLSFNFEGFTLTMPEYTIQSFDGSTWTLTDDLGEELIMTKQ